MGMGIEALFTSALGLQAPWSVEKVELDTVRRRIDFELTCKATRLPCPHCQTAGQGVHDRLQRQWRQRLLFACEGHVVDFAADLQAHGGDPTQIEQVCQDTSAAYAKGVAQALPQAQISYDCFHVIAKSAIRSFFEKI